ncbi:SGNH/GDSL hydrolase family protein [Nocardia sp. NPDC050406]|uniref:SGNH/GDSL hydrolase family protein n=1 Tax=Nocardia sp. NPDC050406 TaxID=3364318 RepID=UPI0037A460AA
MRTSRPHRLPVLAVLIAAAAATTVAAAPVRSAPLFERYVALGDSSAAVGSVDRLQPGSPRFCSRAADNYPSVLAHMLKVAEFADMSCSSARTEHMTTPQTGRGGTANPPQFDALTADTDLVTVTLGANDIGTINVNVISDAQRELIRQRVGAVLDEIHRRAPRATVVLTAYLRYFPPGGGCHGFFDQGGQQRLTDTLRATADAHEARFVDVFAATGHDMCQPPGANWVNGPSPDTRTVPLHANVAGQAYLATAIAAALPDR